ncbi:MAG: hypothetical protein ACWGPN_11330 [Gammaproteobacteria bacterium]
MIRTVLISVVLLGILLFAILRLQSVYEGGLPERANSIDIYAERITYRTRSYDTPSSLSIGLRASTDKPDKVVLHDCSRMNDLETVIDLLRAQNQTSFDIELPDGC